MAAAVHAGRVGAQRPHRLHRAHHHAALGAQPADMSALLGPAVSGANYEVPAAMADEVEAALPALRSWRR
ncbi:hypothetical protein MAHJHV57_51800 [Mycobacterium avium subsp. hominissuis]